MVFYNVVLLHGEMKIKKVINFDELMRENFLVKCTTKFEIFCSKIYFHQMTKKSIFRNTNRYEKFNVL